MNSKLEVIKACAEYYLAEETDRKDTLGLYAYDNTDIFNLNGSPDKKEGVNAKDKYLEKRKAVLKEAYEAYVKTDGGLENIKACISYYGTGQLGYYLQRLTMFYLKNEALSKLSSELKGIINDETYFKWVSWIGLRPYVTDKGKAAEMYKTTVDALRKGNNELLTRDLTMLEMVMEEYSTAKKEYDTLAEAFEEKYYDGGKMNAGLSAEKAGEILDELLGKETATYGTMIPKTEADITEYTERVQIVMRPSEPESENEATGDGTDDTQGQSDGTMGEQTGDGTGENNSDQSGSTDGETEPTTGSTGYGTPKALTYSSVVEAFEAILNQKEVALQNAKTAYINGQSEKVNDSFKNGREYLEEAIKNYATADLEAVKKEAESLWKATPDTQNFFEQWFNYYGSLLNFESLGKESALLGSAKVIHSIQNYLNAFNEILSEKNRAEYESYREELDKSRQVYSNELASLYQQTLEIERAGLIEWNKAYNKLQDKFTDFQNEFINRWNATTEKWQEAIEGFEEDKTDWINAMFMEAESRSLAGLESGSSSAGAALKAARDKVRALDDFDYSGLEKSSLVESVLSDSKISAIESLLNNKASSIEQTKSPAFMLKASDEYKLYQAAQSVTALFEETNKRAEEISARASAQRFKIEIDQKIKDSIKKIDDKNTEMRSSFDERAFTEGYTVKNGYYRKKIVKDVSVFSVDTENVKVRMWKDFEANDPEVNLSLLEENIDAVSFSVIMTLVSAQLTDWENSIFGVSGVVATGDDKASTKTVSYIVGEFEKYAYGEQYKGEVKLGKGLVGKILLDFENNSQKEKAGWEALDAPTWERKLWCSDTFPGPSIREFSTMVASIVATVCTFGAGALLAVAVSAAVMAANELTFEMADVSVGYHDWDEAAKNVAKAAVSGAITGAASSLSGLASEVGGLGGVFLKTGITSSSSITTQFTNAFIDGGFSGVKDAFNSWSDWQGIAFSTAGSFVTNGLGAMNSFDSTGKLLNGNTFNTGAMSSFNSLAGGLTTNALEFAFTGQTTFNLANLSMLGLEYGSMWGAAGTGTISGGFLSMTVGQNGTHFAISSAGTDISLGTLKLAAAGAKESSKVIDWKYGSVETNNNLSVTNYLSYSQSGQNQTLAKDLWSGDTKIEYTDGSNGDLGYHDKENKVIYISKLLLGGGTEGVLQSTSIASHENEHIVGKNEFDEFAARVVGYDTYNELKELFGIENSGKYDNVSDIDSLATLYKEEGAQALFEVLFLSGAFNEDSAGHYITNSSDIHWLQQQYKHLNLPLGEGISKDKIEEYDKQQKEKAYKKYCEVTPDDEKISFDDFSDPKKNYLKKYGYTKATFVNLGDQGCTLSTAVFIYYSITGNFMTLDEANSKLAAAGVFVPSYIADENGNNTVLDDGGQELYLSYGRVYVNAVNALAGEEIITYSNSYWQENDLKKVMIDLQKTPEYYFIHGRTSTPGHPNNTNYHSVLVRGFTYDESGNITGVKVNDPWYGYNTNKDFSNFYRFDVYKLTTTGFNNYAHKDNWYKYTRR